MKIRGKKARKNNRKVEIIGKLKDLMKRWNKRRGLEMQKMYQKLENKKWKEKSWRLK